ncbi:MAG: hypothetical protein HRU15_13910 [Planctomycetes bacterium]|nr:hypothetical protein [Planctomycetota bacterium]
MDVLKYSILVMVYMLMQSCVVPVGTNYMGIRNSRPMVQSKTLTHVVKREMHLHFVLLEFGKPDVIHFQDRHVIYNASHVYATEYGDVFFNVFDLVPQIVSDVTPEYYDCFYVYHFDNNWIVTYICKYYHKRSSGTKISENHYKDLRAIHQNCILDDVWRRKGFDVKSALEDSPYGPVNAPVNVTGKGSRKKTGKRGH